MFTSVIGFGPCACGRASSIAMPSTAIVALETRRRVTVTCLRTYQPIGQDSTLWFLQFARKRRDSKREARRSLRMKVLFATIAAVAVSTLAWAQPARSNFPAPVEGDFIVKNFRFDTGDTLPSLNLHYRTIGTPRRDASGVVRNAVMILHGTGGT